MKMNIGLICFSQTGNTNKIAQSIEKGMMDAGGRCRPIRFENVASVDLASFDLIGIGCPVFYYREPLHVRRWIQSLPDLKGQHFFVFCTHGNIIGNFFPSVADLLHARNAIIIGYFHSYAGIRVPYLPSPGFTAGHPDAVDLSRAEDFGGQMVLLSPLINGPDDPRIPVPGPVSSPQWTAEADRFSPDFLKTAMPTLQWNPKCCCQCGICEDECPVGGINLYADPPRLQTPCIYCWNCVSRCPTQAITADWKRLIDYAPTYFARCREELDKEATNGRFRWLIDPDGVDTKDVFIVNRSASKTSQTRS